MNPSRVAEDDYERSRHMRRLIQGSTTRDVRSHRRRIPKVLVQFWDDAASIPGDVRECLESWKPLEGIGFKRLLFDDSRARRFIGTRFGDRYLAAFERCGHPAMRCDYFRLCFIARVGGFYVDADEYFLGGAVQELTQGDRLRVQPLCYDASTEAMVPAELFTRLGSDSTGWTFYVNNNPIIAPAFHPVVCLALARSTRLLLSNTHDTRDIQATTGPGNLTASVVRHSMRSDGAAARDVEFLSNWEAIAESRWPLSYRNDERNWRIWRQARLMAGTERQ